MVQVALTWCLRGPMAIHGGKRMTRIAGVSVEEREGNVLIFVVSMDTAVGRIFMDAVLKQTTLLGAIGTLVYRSKDNKDNK